MVLQSCGEKGFVSLREVGREEKSRPETTAASRKGRGPEESVSRRERAPPSTDGSNAKVLLCQKKKEQKDK